MFRFIVALLLINSYSGIWGAPTQNTIKLLSSNLNELANSCESPFLATQIRSRIKDCEVPVFPYHKKQFECLLFYDINSQLCKAVATAKLGLSGDYSPIILAKQDVSQLCNNAKDWTFTNISVVYYQTVSSLFRDPLKCSPFCILNPDNILNTESTFYCKYYKWGSEMLKSTISSNPTQEKTISVGQGINENVSVKNDASDPSAVEINEAEIEKPLSKQDVESKNLDPTLMKPTPNNDILVNNVNHEATPTENKNEQSSTTGNQQVPSDNNNINKKPQTESQSPENKPPLHTNEEKQPAAPKDILNALTSTTLSGVNKSKKEGVATEPKLPTNQDNTLNQIDSQKLSNNDDPDAYFDRDSEEAKDGLVDTPGGDDGPDDNVDPKRDEILNKKLVNLEPPSYNNDISPKDTLPDFDEEDDHFFPFFLTAIIMVVVLYILYHNKNKVSKVFLGLIVEGRQTGRRRNSRGHAYRRLDTLEQAMSTNSAAPPSKIIY